MAKVKNPTRKPGVMGHPRYGDSRRPDHASLKTAGAAPELVWARPLLHPPSLSRPPGRRYGSPTHLVETHAITI